MRRLDRPPRARMLMALDMVDSMHRLSVWFLGIWLRRCGSRLGEYCAGLKI